MTNREILNRIKKCFTNFKWPGGYEELALTNRDAFESLISDLLRDAEKEKKQASIEGLLKSWSKIAMNSTYGIYALCPCCHRSCLEMTGDDYFMKHYLINDVKITKKACAVIRAKEEPKPVVFFDEPYTILKWGDFTTVVKCDPEDKFDRLTGLGVALYRYYRQHPDYRKAYQMLMYSFKFDLEDLVLYALLQFCEANKCSKDDLEKKLATYANKKWNFIEF